MSDLPDLPILLALAGEALVVIRRHEGDRPLPEIVLVNRRLTELLGFGREELVGRSIRALRGRGVTRDAFTTFTRALARDTADEIKVSLRTAAKADLPVRIRLAALPTRRDLVSLWITPDETQARRPSAVETLLQALPVIQNLTDGFFYILEITDELQLRIDWLDERATSLLGYTQEELARAGGFAGIVLEDDRPILRAHHQRLIAGEAIATSYRIRTPSRAIRRVHDHARALRNGSSSLAFHIVGAITLAPEAPPYVGPGNRFTRVGAAIASQLHALVCLVSEQGDIVWSSNAPATPLAATIRRAAGRDIALHLSGRHLDDWLDLADQAFNETMPVAALLTWPLEEREARISLYAARVDEDLALVIIRPADEDELAAESNGNGHEPQAPRFDLLDALDMPALLLTVTGAIVKVSSAARPALGMNGDPPRPGLKLRDIVVADQVPALERALDAARHAQRPIEMAFTLRRGRTLLQHRARMIGERAGEQRNGHVILLFGNERASTATNGETLLRARLEAVIEAASDGILVLGSDGTVSTLDGRAACLLGTEENALIGLRPGDFLRPTESNGGGDSVDTLIARLAEAPGRHEVMLVSQAQGAVPVEITARVAETQDSREIVLALRDARLERENDEALRFFAYYDALTGLPNRRLFLERLIQAIDHARAEQHVVGVLLLDLDRFRLINESLGFATGDQVLGAVAGRLVAQSGDQDTVARLSGDEFMLLSPAITTVEAATKAAQRLLETLRRPILIGDHELSLSASIGLALFPSDGATAESLVQNANTACSRATEQGGNRFQFYADEMNSSALQRLMLETRLRRALDQGEFVLYYQPIVRVADGRVLGVEALLRWFHPELGMVSPADFIPLAEETGLIVPIGNWVLDVACRQIVRWQAQFDRPDLRLSVNLSARQFEVDDLPRTITDTLERTHLAPASLELELTESVVMRDPAEAERRMDELTGIGVRLAIDDFGTGYSSLAYLRRFPIHALKIDRTFTKEIERDPGSATIVKAIIGLGENLGIRVVAEGVESQAQLDLLRSWRCEEVQGYHLCRPLPAEEVMNALRNGRLP